MSKVLLFDPAGVLLKERQLDRERIRIGRRAGCEIQLDHVSVSGEHALITTLGNDSFVQDLGSTNGVRVNGKLVKNHQLADGDEIGIAVFRLKFVYEAWVMPSPEWSSTVTRTLKQTVIDNATRSDETLLEVSSSVGLGSVFVDSPGMSSASGGGVGILRLMGGPGAGKQLELKRPVLSLGKPGVQNAVIGRHGGAYFLTYVEGATYPLVNGVEAGATPYELKDHDIIEVAGTRLEFFYK
jgi:hypothetical protein